MTDIELLKCAANAISLEYIECGRLDGSGDLIDRENGQIWNPLTNDGDALRLAVKLELDILNSCISVRAIHRNKDMGASIRCRGNAPQIEPYAATRRAIVRAAAEIGKELP